jgi:hypothetical protein
MRDRRPQNALPLAFTLLCLAACSTELVGPDNVVNGSSETAPGQGAFLISFASTAETYQTDHARRATTWNPPIYNVTMDGKILAEEEGTEGSPVPKLLPISVSEGGLAGVGYLDGGPHQFAVLTPGSAPIWEGDGDIMPGGALRLFVFGPADAEQGRFAFVPNAPSVAGNENITVINLMRSGQSIEVVSCADATTCTPISPPLAMGDLFQTEVPAVGLSEGGYASMTADGAGIGFRLVPSAALPNPIVDALYVGPLGQGAFPPPEVFVAAPVFLSEQGESLTGFN